MYIYNKNNKINTYIGIVIVNNQSSNAISFTRYLLFLKYSFKLTQLHDVKTAFIRSFIHSSDGEAFRLTGGNPFSQGILLTSVSNVACLSSDEETITHKFPMESIPTVTC